MPRDVTADVGLICNKIAVLGVAIDETPCRSWIGKPQAADYMRQSLPFGAAREHRTSVKNYSFMNRKSGGGRRKDKVYITLSGILSFGEV